MRMALVATMSAFCSGAVSKTVAATEPRIRGSSGHGFQVHEKETPRVAGHLARAWLRFDYLSPIQDSARGMSINSSQAGLTCKSRWMSCSR